MAHLALNAIMTQFLSFNNIQMSELIRGRKKITHYTLPMKAETYIFLDQAKNLLCTELALLTQGFFFGPG